jgi:hypothetical protein
MILYNRIELESLTLKGMKLQMQARQSEFVQKLAPNNLHCGRSWLTFIEDYRCPTRYMAQPFVGHPSFSFHYAFSYDDYHD